MIKECGTCRYSVKVFDRRCRRYPPVVAQEKIGFFEHKIVYEFPSVSAHDVCGEWREDDGNWLKYPPTLKKKEA